MLLLTKTRFCLLTACGPDAARRFPLFLPAALPAQHPRGERARGVLAELLEEGDQLGSLVAREHRRRTLHVALVLGEHALDEPPSFLRQVYDARAPVGRVRAALEQALRLQ